MNTNSGTQPGGPQGTVTGGIKQHVPGTAEHKMTHGVGAAATGAGVGAGVGTAEHHHHAHHVGGGNVHGGAGTHSAETVGEKIKKHIPGTAEHRAAHPVGGVERAEAHIPGTAQHHATHQPSVGERIKAKIPGTTENKMSTGNVGGSTY